MIDRDPRLMPATKRLLVRLISHFNLDTGFCRKNKDGSTYSAFPSLDYLEFWLDLSPVTVNRSLEQAYQCGWLTKEKDGVECIDVLHLDIIWNLLKEKKNAWTRIARKKRRTREDLDAIENDRKEIMDAYRKKGAVELEGMTVRAEAKTAPRVEQLEVRKRAADNTLRAVLEHDADVLEPYEQRTGKVIPLKTNKAIH
jgi:hypothetical protein